MDLELSANLKTALSAWVAEAVQHLKGRSELAELTKCMDGDGDVRCAEMPWSLKQWILRIRPLQRSSGRTWCHGLAVSHCRGRNSAQQVYEMGLHHQAKLLPRDEARRIAANIAKLRELLRRP